eukprot:scaffold95252_cov69-Phaeocystis_antarctica.AAC.1
MLGGPTGKPRLRQAPPPHLCAYRPAAPHADQAEQHPSRRARRGAAGGLWSGARGQAARRHRRHPRLRQCSLRNRRLPRPDLVRRRRRLLPACRPPHSALLPPRVCRSLHDGVATELTDGFAFGVTVLMALTGLPAAGIKQRCRHMLKWPTQPQRWQPPGVPDAAAGSWDGGASSGLLEVIQGLDERWAEDRMPLPDVLARLEAMVVAAAAVSSLEAEVAATAEEARVCIICEEAPRE